MKCDDAVGLLLPALQRQLGPDEERALGLHAADCPVCSQELPELQALWSVLDEWTDEDPPLRLVESLRRRIREGAR